MYHGQTVRNAVTETSIRSVAAEIQVPRTAVHGFISGARIAAEHLAAIEAWYRIGGRKGLAPVPDGPDVETLRADVALAVRRDSLRAVAAAAQISKSAVADFFIHSGTAARERTVVRFRRWYQSSREGLVTG